MRAIFFDFDGTLLDSYRLYFEIMRTFFSDRHVDPVENQKPALLNSISAGGQELFSSIMGSNYSEEDVSKFRLFQLELVQEDHLFLDPIQINNLSVKYRLYLYSSKPHNLCSSILDKLKLTDSFVNINGLNGPYPKKPSRVFFDAMNNIGQFSDSIFVGDSDIDYYTAKSCGIDYIHCAWGYGPSRCINDYNKVIYSPMELFKYLSTNT